MWIILLIILLIIYHDMYISRYSYFNSTVIQSETDGNSYPVLSKFSDQQNASNMIGELNNFSMELLTRLKKRYLTITPITPDQIKGFEVASILSKNYHPSSLQENDPPNPQETSYNQNKGQVISLCLRRKEDGALHDIDRVKFVFLHELAHTITPEIIHSNNFWTNFRFLLEFCEREGLYYARNFNIEPTDYCGMTINYNPMQDYIRTVSYF